MPRMLYQCFIENTVLLTMHFFACFRAPEVRANTTYISVTQEEFTPEDIDPYTDDSETNPFCTHPVLYGSVQGTGSDHVM